MRAAPGVILVPIETQFGWDRALISLAVSISLITFGLGGHDYPAREVALLLVSTDPR